MFEESNNETFEELNPSTLKKMVLLFEKKYNNNQQMRAKYAGNPEKFMDSEIELDTEITKLQIIATAPELYPLFVKLGVITSLGSLLLHENTDIVIDIIDLFKELTEQESLVEDETLALTNSLYENNILETLVQVMETLDSTNTDDQKAIQNILGIFENQLELKPMEASQILVDKSNLLAYLIKTIKSKSNILQIRLYCCEILSIVLQENELARRKFGQLDGIEFLLVCVSPFKKKSPESLEENEMVENIFSSLCTCLFDNDNKQLFLRAEGIDLMLMFINSALKVLDFALGKHKASAEKFIDVLGLKTLFSNMMKKIKSKHSKKIYNEQEDEESDYEKVGRWFDLREKYARRLKTAEEKIRNEVDEDDDVDEDEIYFKRLDAGLFKLQHIDLIIGILYGQDVPMKQKIQSIMEQRNIDIREIIQILTDYQKGMETSLLDATNKETEMRYIGLIIEGLSLQ
eukprot:gene14864-17577_t